MTTEDEQPQFHCQFCPKAFARQEHLTRHNRAHTLEKPYRCTQCDKSFSRQDVLQRHKARHRTASVTRQTVSTRACKECALGRVRCSKEWPCGRCQERNLQCLYPESRRRKTRTITQPRASTGRSLGTSPARSSNEDEATEDDTGAEEQIRVLPNSGVADGEISNGSASAWTVNGLSPSLISPMNRSWTTTGEPATTAPQQLEPIFQINDLGDFAINNISDPLAGLSSTNWLSHDQDIVMWESQLSDIPYGLGSLASPGPAAVLSWLPGQSTNMGTPNTISSSFEPGYEPTHVITKSLLNGRAESPHGSSVSRSTQGTLYVEGAVARAPFRGRHVRERTYSHSSAFFTKESQLDMQSSNNETSRSLEEVESQDSVHTYVSDDFYSSMVQAARHSAENLSIQLNDTSIPPLGHIRCFVRLYYQNFHPAYPFLRNNPSIWEDSSGWILLLAVSSIGAKYLGGPWSSSISELLDKILEDRLGSLQDGIDSAWRPFSFEPENRTDLTTLQAAILHLICRLHSGRQNMVKKALSQRLFIVEECRKMNLLSCTLPTVDSSDPYGNAAVAAWLQAQSRIRTGMMVWILESIVAYEFDCPHVLQLQELKSPLPCHEDIWNMPHLNQIGSDGSQTVTILEALDLLYMEKRQPSNLTEFGNVILIYAVCRRTKEALYQHQTALARWTPIAHVEPHIETNSVGESWPPSLQIITRWRNSACDSLDILHWKANGKAADAGGSEHPTILHLHLSRLYLLTPSGHLQKVAAAASCTNPNSIPNESVYIEACNHLRRWANLDQYKARLSMVHAGALLWHVRRYSSNGFIEPHAVYLATLSVWAYSVFTKKAKAISQEIDCGGESIDSSHLGPELSSDATAKAMEADQGSDEEPEPSFIHLDRPCDDEMVQVYIRLGHKMKGYMLRVGDICSSDAPPKILQEGIRLLSHGQDKGKSWGIETSFIQSLKSLLSAITAQGSS